MNHRLQFRLMAGDGEWFSPDKMLEWAWHYGGGDFEARSLDELTLLDVEEWAGDLIEGAETFYGNPLCEDFMDDLKCYTYKVWTSGVLI